MRSGGGKLKAVKQAKGMHREIEFSSFLQGLRDNGVVGIPVSSNC